MTAAHCLPKLPPAHPASYAHERTYRLPGPLHASKPSVMAECQFADPVADVAVLGMPDAQAFVGADDAFEELIDGVAVLPLGDISQDTTGWLLFLEGEWRRCRLEITRTAYSDTLWIKDAAGIVGRHVRFADFTG